MYCLLHEIIPKFESACVNGSIKMVVKDLSVNIKWVLVGIITLALIADVFHNLSNILRKSAFELIFVDMNNKIEPISLQI